VSPTDKTGNSAIDWCQVVPTNRAPQITMNNATRATSNSDNGSTTRRNGGGKARTTTETFM